MAGERPRMSRVRTSQARESQAYVIEILNRTAGIVASDGRSFRFFSSERAFDSLEGRNFPSARHAERAARALFDSRRAPAAAR